MDYQRCCEAAMIGLASVKELISYPCPKCGAVYYDPAEQAKKLHAQHRYIVCKYKWSKYPLMQGNPLAMLGCQLKDSTLFVKKLPVDSSKLGVADHRSGCCLRVGTGVGTRGKHD